MASAVNICVESEHTSSHVSRQTSPVKGKRLCFFVCLYKESSWLYVSVPGDIFQDGCLSLMVLWNFGVVYALKT